MAKGKPFWWSKTFWANILAIGSMILADKFGITITPEQATALLGLINIALRLITKEPIVWNLKDNKLR